MTRECYNCGSKEKLIYLTNEDKLVCVECYEFKLPKKTVEVTKRRFL